MLANQSIACRPNAAKRPDAASSYRGSLVTIMCVVYHKIRLRGEIAANARCSATEVLVYWCHMKTKILGKHALTLFVALGLAFASRLADAGMPKPPNRRVTMVRVWPQTEQGQRKTMLDALNNGDTQTVARLLGGLVHVDEVLCFGEEQWPCAPCTNQINTSILVPGVHIWHERAPNARALADCFWRAYPRAADGAVAHGSIRLYGTPLMAACRARNEKLVSFLLRRGANPNMFVKLGDGKWLYALREPYVNAMSARDRAKAERIRSLLVEAGAVMIDGDDLHAAVSLTPDAERTVNRLRREENWLVAQKREAARQMAQEMEIARLQRQSEAIRGEIEAEKYRQKGKAIQEEMSRRERAHITGQTLEQFNTTERLNLDLVNPGTHSSLRRDPSNGDLYKVDVHGNAYKINPHDRSLIPVHSK